MGDRAAIAPVALSALLARVNIDMLSVTRDALVSSVVLDSRAVEPGALFFCVRGALNDGHRFISAAIHAGAAAIVVDRPPDLYAESAALDRVAIIEVNDVRRSIGPLCATFYREPSRSLSVLGVTGTNGKTTTVHLIASVLSACGVPTETIGTLSGARTTPEAPELQARLADALDHRARAVAVEVSSHALSQHRVDGTHFAAVAFTNLTPDHLDYHRTMDDYFAAKRRLFDPGFSSVAVIDVDGPYGHRLAAETAISSVVRSGAGSVEVLSIDATGSRVLWRGREMSIPIGGRFNVSNAAVAADVAATCGVDEADIAAAMRTVPPVPGRFEHVDIGQPFAVIVDYAHTPDGLLRVLQAAREVAGGRRVIAVFGCGGDRDAAKRPLMGAEAARHADVVVVTSDNPRSEDPAAIITAIVSGMTRPPSAVEPDRRRAIDLAIELARPGDVVVIAGKGHETTQTIGPLVVPFDDRLVAREALVSRYAS